MSISRRIGKKAVVCIHNRIFSSIQLLSRVQLFVTPWTAARQAPLSFTDCLPEVAQILVHWVGDAVQPPHPLLSPFSSCPQSSPASGAFPMSQFFISGGQSIGVSASASILLMNIQNWFPLGLTGSISLLSKGRSRVFSSTTVQFFGALYSTTIYVLYSTTLTYIHDCWKNHTFD